MIERIRDREKSRKIERKRGKEKGWERESVEGIFCFFVSTTLCFIPLSSALLWQRWYPLDSTSLASTNVTLFVIDAFSPMTEYPERTIRIKMTQSTAGKSLLQALGKVFWNQFLLSQEGNINCSYYWYCHSNHYNYLAHPYWLSAPPFIIFNWRKKGFCIDYNGLLRSWITNYFLIFLNFKFLDLYIPMKILPIMSDIVSDSHLLCIGSPSTHAISTLYTTLLYSTLLYSCHLYTLLYSTHAISTLYSTLLSTLPFISSNLI